MEVTQQHANVPDGWEVVSAAHNLPDGWEVVDAPSQAAQGNQPGTAAALIRAGSAAVVRAEPVINRAAKFVAVSPAAQKAIGIATGAGLGHSSGLGSIVGGMVGGTGDHLVKSAARSVAAVTGDRVGFAMIPRTAGRLARFAKVAGGPWAQVLAEAAQLPFTESGHKTDLSPQQIAENQQKAEEEYRAILLRRQQDGPSIPNRIAAVVKDNASKVKRTIGTVGSDLGGMAADLGHMLITPIGQQGTDVANQLTARTVAQGPASASVDAAEMATGVPLRQMATDLKQGNYPELLGHATVAAGALAGPHIARALKGPEVAPPIGPKPKWRMNPDGTFTNLVNGLVVDRTGRPVSAPAAPASSPSLPGGFGKDAFAGPVTPAALERTLLLQALNKDAPLDVSDPLAAARMMALENPQIRNQANALAQRARDKRKK